MLHTQATLEQQREADAARLYEKVRLVRGLVSGMHDTLTEQGEQISEIEEGLRDATGRTADLAGKARRAAVAVRRKGVLTALASGLGFTLLIVFLIRF